MKAEKLVIISFSFTTNHDASTIPEDTFLHMPDPALVAAVAVAAVVVAAAVVISLE